MVGKSGGPPHRSAERSRLNKRIQELEERVARVTRDLRQVHELIGTKVDTKELLACVGQQVRVKDVTGHREEGVLERVGKWTIVLKNGDEIELYFKGNLISVKPRMEKE